MEYSEEFQQEIEEIEDTAIHLANCETVGQIDIQQKQQLAAQLDYIINKFPISCEAITQHIEEVKSIWKTRENLNTASKHIETVHQAFLDEVCEDYKPHYWFCLVLSTEDISDFATELYHCLIEWNCHQTITVLY